MSVNYDVTGNPMEEVTFKFFDDSYWIVRPSGIGDTICGSFAHKIMFAHSEFVRRGNIDSFGTKLDFIMKWSEDIANNPNGIYS